MELVKFVYEFISSNPFIVCSEELSHVKKQLLREGDELKVKQKAGSLHYIARQARYVWATWCMVEPLLGQLRLQCPD